MRLAIAAAAAVVVVVLGLLAGCGGSDSDSTSAACDESSISEAVSAAGEQQDGTTATLDPDGFDCADDWAYAFADVGSGEEEVTVTFVFKSSDGAWVVQDRETVCKAPGDQVPEAIYKDACESN